MPPAANRPGSLDEEDEHRSPLSPDSSHSGTAVLSGDALASVNKRQSATGSARNFETLNIEGTSSVDGSFCRSFDVLAR